jgi:hypothetical protein
MTQSKTVSALYWVLLGGVAVGTLDLLFATSFWAARGIDPIRIPQSIAAGLLGREAYAGGANTAWLGAALHYWIATGMVLAFFLVSRWWPALIRRPLAFGAAYGVFLYGFMQYVVLPLSAAQPGHPDAVWISASIVAHAILVGIPCALFSRRAAAYSRNRSSNDATR